MTLRIKPDVDLDTLSPHVRRQVERAIGESRELHETPQRRSGALRQPEQAEGAAVVRWIDAVELPDGLRPGLYFAHVPNGGARTPTEGAILKGQGVRAGWPDYVLDLPLGGYHGWRGELKAPEAGKPDAEQLEVLGRLESMGYRICIAWSAGEMIASIKAYLAGGGYHSSHRL